MNENTCVLIAILYIRRVFFAVENPSSTYYFKHPTMAALMLSLGLTTTTVWMILFGHWMPKPSLIAGGSWVESLRNVYSAKRAAERKEQLKQQIKSLNLKFGRKTASKWHRNKQKAIEERTSIKHIGPKWITAGGP